MGEQNETMEQGYGPLWTSPDASFQRRVEMLVSRLLSEVVEPRAVIAEIARIHSAAPAVQPVAYMVEHRDGAVAGAAPRDQHGETLADKFDRSIEAALNDAGCGDCDSALDRAALRDELLEDVADFRAAGAAPVDAREREEAAAWMEREIAWHERWLARNADAGPDFILSNREIIQHFRVAAAALRGALLDTWVQEDAARFQALFAEIDSAEDHDEQVVIYRDYDESAVVRIDGGYGFRGAGRDLRAAVDTAIRCATVAGATYTEPLPRALAAALSGTPEPPASDRCPLCGKESTTGMMEACTECRARVGLSPWSQPASAAPSRVSGTDGVEPSATYWYAGDDTGPHAESCSDVGGGVWRCAEACPAWSRWLRETWGAGTPAVTDPDTLDITAPPEQGGETYSP